MEEITGIIKGIIYSSKNYCVFKLKCEKFGDIICVYDSDNIFEEEYVNLKGNFELNKKYGNQFLIKFLEKIEPSSIVEIEKYLSSSLFVGIGLKTAKKIVDKFKEDTLEILEHNIDRIKEVEGIGNKKFLEIKSSIKERLGSKKVIMDLTKIGLSLNNANILYDLYNDNALNVIKEDPYLLIEKLKGFGFKKADLIGERLCIEKNFFGRVKQGIIYVLKDVLKFGSTYILYEELIKLSSELLNVKLDRVVEVYNEFLSEGIIIEKNLKNNDDRIIKCVFLSNVYLAEYDICSSLIRLFIYSKIKINIDIFKEINAFERKNNLKFSSDQVNALRGSFENGVQVITGGPGTGKTTIIKFILDMCIKNNLKVMLVAPTGRAAKRMMETTGYEAKTIHRMLEIGTSIDEEYEFEFVGKDDKNVVNCDVIIIDEASMIDVIIASKLFKSLKIGTKVVIVGDVDQLPSVGPGSFLKDVINSGIFSVSRLNKIYRQKNNSYIVLNAHKINNGEELILNKKDGDFYILKNDNEEDILNVVMDLVKNRLPKFFSYKIDILKDIQILAPMRKGILGVNNLNKVFQENINRKTENSREISSGDNIFRVNDKVMQIKNNYEISGYYEDSQVITKGVFNGDIGYVKSVTSKSINVVFDSNRVIKYDKMNFNELEHAYAITIHKSQGSEFPIIIIPIFRYSSIIMNRNLLYTAVTRAKKYVVLVGSYDGIRNMINNTTSSKRYSSLCYLFKEVINLSIGS